MTKYFEGKIVDVASLETVLSDRSSGVVFSDKNEARQFIDEIVCALVERPAYSESDLDFAQDGGDIYDLFDNVDALRDMQNEIVDRITAEQNLV